MSYINRRPLNVRAAPCHLSQAFWSMGRGDPIRVDVRSHVCRCMCHSSKCKWSGEHQMMDAEFSLFGPIQMDNVPTRGWSTLWSFLPAQTSKFAAEVFQAWDLSCIKLDTVRRCGDKWKTSWGPLVGSAREGSGLKLLTHPLGRFDTWNWNISSAKSDDTHIKTTKKRILHDQTVQNDTNFVCNMFFLIPQFWSSPKAAVEFHPNLTWALFRSPGFDRQHWSSATCQVRYRLEIPSCNILYILYVV